MLNFTPSFVRSNTLVNRHRWGNRHRLSPRRYNHLPIYHPPHAHKDIEYRLNVSHPFTFVGDEDD